nr:MAG TPA: hypothetical protein [Caudoviricetes sp.]
MTWLLYLKAIQPSVLQKEITPHIVYVWGVFFYL